MLDAIARAIPADAAVFALMADAKDEAAARFYRSMRTCKSFSQPHFDDVDCKQIGVTTFDRFNPIVCKVRSAFL